IAQSESLTIRLIVFDAGGSLLPLGGQSLVLTVRKGPNLALLFPERSGTVQPQLGSGVADFEFTQDDVRPDATQHGQYAYDVSMTSPGGERSVLVPVSPFILEPSVGRP